MGRADRERRPLSRAGAGDGRRGADGRRRADRALRPRHRSRAQGRAARLGARPPARRGCPRARPCGSTPPRSRRGTSSPSSGSPARGTTRTPGPRPRRCAPCRACGPSSPSACATRRCGSSSRRPRSTPGGRPRPCCAEARRSLARAGPRLEPPGRPPAARGGRARRQPREPADPGGRRRRAPRLSRHDPRPTQAGAGRGALPRRARPGPLRLAGARRGAARPWTAPCAGGWPASPAACAARSAGARPIPCASWSAGWPWPACSPSVLAAPAGAWLAGRWGALALGLAIPAAVAAAANAFLLAGVPLNVATLAALAVAAVALLPLAALRLTRRPAPGPGGSPPSPPPRWCRWPSPSPAPSWARCSPSPPWRCCWRRAAGVLAVMLLPVPLSRRAVRWEGTADGGEGLSSPPSATPAPSSSSPRPPPISSSPSSAAPSSPGREPAAGPGEPDGDPPAPPGDAARGDRPPGGQAGGGAGQGGGGGAVLESTAAPGIGAGHGRAAARGAPPERRRLLATRLRYEAAGVGRGGDLLRRPRPSRHGRRLPRRPRGPCRRRTRRRPPIASSCAAPTSRAVRAGYDRLLARLATLKVRRTGSPAGATPTVQLVLRPRAGTPPAEAARIAAALRGRAAPPPSLPLPGRLAGRGAALAHRRPRRRARGPRPRRPAAGRAARPAAAPGRAGRSPPAPSSPSRKRPSIPRVARQSGRFVVPVEIQLLLSGEEVRKQSGRRSTAASASSPCPPACDLERPSLKPRLWERERLRLIALGLAVPLLLFAVAACRLGSLAARRSPRWRRWRVGLVAALPLVAHRPRADRRAHPLRPRRGPGAGAPLGGGRGGRSRGDRRAASTAPCAGRPPGSLARGAGPGPRPRGAHARRGAGAAAWAVPLRAAAVAGGASLAASALLVPALLLAGRPLARARSRRGAAAPPAAALERAG